MNRRRGHLVQTVDALQGAVYVLGVERGRQAGEAGGHVTGQLVDEAAVGHLELGVGEVSSTHMGVAHLRAQRRGVLGRPDLLGVVEPL